MDEERTRPGGWLGLVLCIAVGAMTLGGRKDKKPCSINPQTIDLFRSGAGGGGPRRELAHPGLPGKTAINWK